MEDTIFTKTTIENLLTGVTLDLALFDDFVLLFLQYSCILFLFWNLGGALFPVVVHRGWPVQQCLEHIRCSCRTNGIGGSCFLPWCRFSEDIPRRPSGASRHPLGTETGKLHLAMLEGCGLGDRCESNPTEAVRTRSTRVSVSDCISFCKCFADRFPDTFAAQYMQGGCSPDNYTRIMDILKGKEEQGRFSDNYQCPDGSSLVVHLRLGDKVEKAYFEILKRLDNNPQSTYYRFLDGGWSDKLANKARSHIKGLPEIIGAARIPIVQRYISFPAATTLTQEKRAHELRTFSVSSAHSRPRATT